MDYKAEIIKILEKIEKEKNIRFIYQIVRAFWNSEQIENIKSSQNDEKIDQEGE